MKYNIIYADPPWDYGNTKNVNGKFYGIADRHYPVMKLKDIEELPVNSIAADVVIVTGKQIGRAHV